MPITKKAYMDEFLRRTSDYQADANDKTGDRILELIESTPDSKDKAFLLILLRLNTNIYNNTNIVTSVAAKLDKHLTVFEEHANDELKRLSQNTGTRKVLFYISGIVQPILFATALYFQSTLVDLKEFVVQQQIVITQNTSAIQTHDKILDQIVKKLDK